MRTFPSGSTRDEDKEKIDPEGFLSPIVIQRYCEYMQKHRKQADGKLRESDNWQRGMEKSVYMKSLWRHFLDLWLEHRGEKSRDGLEDAICGILFNAMGYLYEELKNENLVKKVKKPQAQNKKKKVKEKIQIQKRYKGIEFEGQR